MRRLTNLSLFKKITLLTAIGLALAVGVFSFLGMRAVNQATEAMLQDRLTTAHLVANYLDETLGQATIELEKTAQAVDIEGTRSNIETHLTALKEVYQRLSVYSQGIYLFNQQGQLVWSQAVTQSAVVNDVFSYPGLSEIIASEEPGVSGLALALATNTPVVLLTSPTREGQGGSRGVLVAAIDLAKSSVSGFVQPAKLGTTGYIEIIDQHGLVVARTEPGPAPAPFEKSDHQDRFAALINTGEPVRGVCHTCHEPEQTVKKRDVLAFVPLSAARWGVVIRQAEEEALAPVRDLRQSLLLFGVILAFTTFLLVTITTRDVTRRIRKLATASRKIADGDLTSPVALLGRDEVGILAQTFDEMRTKLKVSYEELAELHRAVKRQDEIRGELLRDLLSIQEEERKRIARELHDETSQVLTSLNVNLEAAISRLPPNIAEVKSILKKTQNQSLNILEEIHRLIYQLRPTVLDDLGLVTAIRWLAENNLEKAGVIVNFKTTGRVNRLDGQAEIILFRVIQEVVRNITRHAEARSVDIRLHFKKSALKVRVTDDGRGFDVEEAISKRDGRRGLGLLGMKERVGLARGSLDIRSRPGGGTEITIEIPLNQEA